MTKYEKSIYDIINTSRDHLMADQVLDALRKIYPAVSQATVYNNLKKLSANGLIKQISLPDSPARYDRVQRHDHLVCQHCGRLADVSFEDLTDSLRQQLGSDVLSYDLKVTYICPECRKAMEEAEQREDLN